MILYHFTAARNLRPISKHGITFGDVPTDLRKNRGKVGVWLTTSPYATGHGLSGSSACKTRYRLTVDAPPSPSLVQWSEWAPRNITAETMKNLIDCAGKDGASQWQTWLIYFGVIPASAILDCYDTENAASVECWADIWPAEFDAPAVPGWRREALHRQVLKRFSKHVRAVEATGAKFVF